MRSRFDYKLVLVPVVCDKRIEVKKVDEREIVKAKGGACVDCPLTGKELVVDFPSRRPTLQSALENARVRVRCPRHQGGTILIKVKVILKDYKDCPHYKKPS